MKTKSILRGQSNTHQSFWVAAGSASSFLFTIVSAAILSRYFDKQEYGTYRQIIFVYNTLLVVFSAGLPKVFAYFLPKYSISEGKDIVKKITGILIIFGAVFSKALFFSSNLIARVLNNQELARGLKYFSPIPILLLPTLGIEGIFATYKKTIYIAIYNILTRTSMLIFIVTPVILLEGSYIHAIYGWIVVSIISFIIAIVFKHIPYRKTNRVKTSLSFKDIFSYSLPLMTASLAGLAIRSADQFYISRYFGTEVFAEYSNGFIQLPFVSMVTGAAAMVLMPQYSKLFHDKAHHSEILTLWNNAIKKSALIIYPIVMFAIFNAGSIIVLLYSKTYSNSIIYFKIALILNFFNIITVAPVLLSRGKSAYYSKIQILFAFIKWTGGYIMILITSNPVAIAIYSVAVNIVLIFVFLVKIGNLLDVSLNKLIPLSKISLIVLHTFIVISIIKILEISFLDGANLIIKLITNLFLFTGLLLVSSKLFRINYLVVIKPIINRNKDEKQI